MIAKHSHWTRQGRRLVLHTGQHVYTGAIGQRNLELADGSFVPYQWDKDKLRWHRMFATFANNEANWHWDNGNRAGNSKFVLRRYGVDIPGIATWERLPDQLRQHKLAEGKAAGTTIISNEVARIKLTLVAEDALATITFHAGGNTHAYASFDLLALSRGWELVCIHEYSKGFNVRVESWEPWRRVTRHKAVAEFALPMPRGERTLVSPDTFGPVDIATSSDDVMGDAGGYQQDGDGGFGTIYCDDTDGGGGYYVSGFRWASVDLTGATSIDSGTQVLYYRASNNNGANGTCIIAAEDSNTPATYSTSARPYARTYLTTALATHNFPNDGTNQTPSLVTQIGGLLGEGYSYTGSATHAIALGVGANQFDTILGTSLISGNVAWRTICRDLSFGSSTASELTVVFTVGAGGIGSTGASSIPVPQVSGTGTVSVGGTGAPVIPKPQVSATASVSTSGSGSPTIPKPLVSATASVIVGATGAPVIPIIQVAGAASFGAIGSPVIPIPQVSALASVIIGATGAVVIPIALVSGTAGPPVSIDATGSVTMPILLVSGLEIAPIFVGGGGDVDIVVAPKLRPAERQMNQNQSSLRGADTLSIIQAIEELQEIVREQRAQIIQATSVEADGMPTHGTPCPIFKGQYLRLTQRGPAPYHVLVYHGLGRRPQGIISIRSSSVNQAIIEGDLAVPLGIATKDSVPIRLNGVNGETHVLILF